MFKLLILSIVIWALTY